MYRTILVAYNGSPESRYALHECIKLAPGSETQVHLVVVVTPPPYLLVGEYAAAAVLSVEEGLVAEKQKMEQEIAAGHALLAEAGLNVTDHLEVGEPADVIQSLSNQLNADLIIVGHSRQKPFALRWWRGSIDAVLLEKIRCSLLVAAGPRQPA
ncbi:universal stress protein [Noviherbaspirillum suwonense]|jgi:nucleotide-binding universal stress UspA family protein|uniref:Nucleotide-binding universal stress protein, UspA family n=1 Tax=Noviherbaspirillum suwonense TaxID=1224511 RepID=A0ABY1QJZ1_9BURK|nr:universal stress protein [Noviherbaspirillum suwonense]SMP70073.1 Nucleotide-binding universal stress protein, UspA family [Noviherbaspirillum suwonense]